jgi:hypothetical protein
VRHGVAAYEGSGQRVTTLAGGIKVLVTGEHRSAACRALADAQTSPLKLLIDRELPPDVIGTSAESYQRYVIADQIPAALGAAAE